MTQTIFELKPGSFVFEKKNALAGDVCAEMINRFEKTPDDQYPGRIGQQGLKYIATTWVVFAWTEKYYARVLYLEERVTLNLTIRIDLDTFCCGFGPEDVSAHELCELLVIVSHRG